MYRLLEEAFRHVKVIGGFGGAEEALSAVGFPTDAPGVVIEQDPTRMLEQVVALIARAPRLAPVPRRGRLTDRPEVPQHPGPPSGPFPDRTGARDASRPCLRAYPHVAAGGRVSMDAQGPWQQDDDTSWGCDAPVRSRRRPDGAGGRRPGGAVCGCSGSADPVLDSFASPTAASTGATAGATAGAAATPSGAAATPAVIPPPVPVVPGAVVARGCRATSTTPGRRR